MSEVELTWCWRCRTEHLAWATECSQCGGELHSSPPPGTPVVSHETLEIDLSGMEAAARDMFLLFLDGAGIAHQVSGYLLSISVDDEERTRQLLETITADTLVELDPLDAAGPSDPGAQEDDAEWNRSVAAMMHPSSGGDEPLRLSGTSRRVAAAMVSWFVWWIGVILVYSVLALLSGGEPPFGLVVAVSLLPVLGDTWWTARSGSTPGKFLMDMRTVGQHGAPPGWRSSIIRTLVLRWPILLAYWPGVVGRIASTAALPWMVLLIITIVRDPGNKGLHDRAAGTLVVDGRRAPNHSS